MVFTKDNLDDFVRQIDRNGGPDSIEAAVVFERFLYQSEARVQLTLDPHSEEYWEQQIQLYKEISGRDLDQTKNEISDFDIEGHVRAANPFACNDPAQMSIHYGRLSKLIKYADLKNNANVLDLGCGWGISSELFTMMGCRVTAVDINQKSIELIKRRSARLQLPIRAIHSNFDDLYLDEKFDLIVFNESLHHAVKPAALLQKVAGWLATDGKIGLAGEPIQNIWWPSWGLRLDAISIYCMRKYGWFESGWSKDYIVDALSERNLSIIYKDDIDPEIGPIIIATRKEKRDSPEPSSIAELGPPADTIRTKAARRMSLLRHGAGLIRQALSPRFLFRK